MGYKIRAMVTLPLPRFFQGRFRFVISRVGRAMINLPTKFEVYLHPLFRRCKVWKVGWFEVVRGHPRSLAMSPFDGAHAISYSSLIETMRHLVPFWRYGELFVEIRRLYPTPPVFGAPVGLGVTPFEFRKDFWRQKTRVPGLSCGVVCVILSVAVLIQYRLVTDGQTDRHTDTRRQLIPR